MNRNEHKFYLGKCDYNNSGRNDCKAFITWTFENGNFSMCAEIWDPKGFDIYIGGQCVDTVAAYFKGNRKAQRMVEIWERYHMNDMLAGSAAQMEYLREHPLDPASYAYPKSHYDVASAVLASAGLNPDANGYLYGHAWKREEIPAEIAAEIESWSAPIEQAA